MKRVMMCLLILASAAVARAALEGLPGPSGDPGPTGPAGADGDPFSPNASAALSALAGHEASVQAIEAALVNNQFVALPLSAFRAMNEDTELQWRFEHNAGRPVLRRSLNSLASGVTQELPLEDGALLDAVGCVVRTDTASTCRVRLTLTRSADPADPTQACTVQLRDVVPSDGSVPTTHAIAIDANTPGWTAGCTVPVNAAPEHASTSRYFFHLSGRTDGNGTCAMGTFEGIYSCSARYHR